MSGVVADMAGPPNHPGDPLQGPQVRGEAPRGGTFQQGRLQALARCPIQAGFAPGSAWTFQSQTTVATPGTIPAVRGRATDLETADNLSLWVALAKQSGGFHPTGFQGREVPPRPKRRVHAPRPAQRRSHCYSILRISLACQNGNPR